MKLACACTRTFESSMRSSCASRPPSCTEQDVIYRVADPVSLFWTSQEINILHIITDRMEERYSDKSTAPKRGLAHRNKPARDGSQWGLTTFVLKDWNTRKRWRKKRWAATTISSESWNSGRWFFASPFTMVSSFFGKISQDRLQTQEKKEVDSDEQTKYFHWFNNIFEVWGRLVDRIFSSTLLDGGFSSTNYLLSVKGWKPFSTSKPERARNFFAY